MIRQTSTPAALFRLGRYRLLRRLGRGGMATVYHAVQEGPHGFENEVAVKLLHAELLESAPHVVQMLVDEARVASRVRQPNVVRILDLCDEGNHVYLVMDYVDGVSLRDVLDRCRETGKPPPIKPLLEILAAACEGLQAAHRTTRFDGSPLSLVHRDVKPGNILVGAFGEVKVADFGVARFDDRFVESTVQGQMKGTPAYMSPEQVLGRSVDARADIFSMGITLYTLLTTKLAFSAETPVGVALRLAHESMEPHARELEAMVPGLGDIIRRACDKDPDARYGSAEEMGQALRELSAPGTATVRDIVQLGGWKPWKPDMVPVANELSLDDSVPRGNAFNRSSGTPVRAEIVPSGPVAAGRDAVEPDEPDTFDEIDRTEPGDGEGRTEPGKRDPDLDELFLDSLSAAADPSASTTPTEVESQPQAAAPIAAPTKPAPPKVAPDPTGWRPTADPQVIDLIPSGRGSFGPASGSSTAVSVPGDLSVIPIPVVGEEGAGAHPPRIDPSPRPRPASHPIAAPIHQPWGHPGGAPGRKVPGPIPAGSHGRGVPGPLPQPGRSPTGAPSASAPRPGHGGDSSGVRRASVELDYRGRAVRAPTAERGSTTPGWVEKAVILGGLLILAFILWFAWKGQIRDAGMDEQPTPAPGSLIPEPLPPPAYEPARGVPAAVAPVVQDLPVSPDKASAGAPSPTSLRSTREAAAAAAALFPSTQKALPIPASTPKPTSVKTAPPSVPTPPVAAGPGTLSVNSYPWSKVMLDGKEVGNTPLSGISVPAGHHELRLVFADGREHDQGIDVQADEETKVVKKLPPVEATPAP